MAPFSRFPVIDDYEQYIGAESVERIKKKADNLRDAHVVHVNATYYGGGVAELLESVTLLMNTLGIKTGWRVIQGSPDFFGLTKKIHNALQGEAINFTPRKVELLEHVIRENALRNHLDHDLVVIHDPQPLLMINEYRRRGPWVWVCHVDMSEPNEELWKYLSPVVEKYDAVVLSLEEYKQQLSTPQVFIMPGINPFSIKNRRFRDEEIEERLDHHGIPTDLPLVVQISRFDRWKDPRGVIEAFEMARKEVPATLVLLGNVAADDPEGPDVYRSLLDCRSERVIIKSTQDTALVNALQSRAAVVLQKSIREGFGLTVAEAMWKGTPVIGGNTGGIKHQIEDGVNGFLVSSVDEAAQRIVQVLKDKDLSNELGTKARETVMRKFLITRYVEQYLDLLNSFETVYKFHYPES